MAGGQLQDLARHLRRAATPGDSVGRTDAQLLVCFAATGDEAAFELLVWRHAGMVLGLCRRLLSHEQDAEDACQAAFMALARKAGSLGRRESVGGWLYRVASRAALKLKSQRGRRRARERPLEGLPPSAGPGPGAEAAWRELRGALDEEVGRLPQAYREAFVLCALAGK